MMAFFQSETGKAPCSFAHSFLEEHLPKWCPKYHFESVFLLLNDQECDGSRRFLLILVRFKEYISYSYNPKEHWVLNCLLVGTADHCFRDSVTKFLI